MGTDVGGRAAQGQCGFYGEVPWREGPGFSEFSVVNTNRELYDRRRLLKKTIVILTLTMLATRLPASEDPSPILSIAYNQTNNTVSITAVNAQPKATLILQTSTNLTNAIWANMTTGFVLNTGKVVWTNIAVTNSQTFFQTAYLFGNDLPPQNQPQLDDGRKPRPNLARSIRMSPSSHSRSMP
jgi:hypothetical protein